ncbi:MAG: tetratricopeptide repeat protein [Rhodospirillales bacterium]|nr:tetratricopeptide repeat protein [Alphaproteobacteria bacterium]MBL6947811.1 tetratricopeptide repeat protein [Rhodospirillales bacterium]
MRHEGTIELEPNFAEAHFNLGLAFLELGEYENALLCSAVQTLWIQTICRRQHNYPPPKSPQPFESFT